MINPNEAPKGYIAIPSVCHNMCTGCAMRGTGCIGPTEGRCQPRHRKDNSDVIYAKRPELQLPEDL